MTDGVVTLKGDADSYLKKWSQKRARTAYAGSAVANEIDVRLPSSSERTDGGQAATASWRCLRSARGRCSPVIGEGVGGQRFSASRRDVKARHLRAEGNDAVRTPLARLVHRPVPGRDSRCGSAGSGTHRQLAGESPLPPMQRFRRPLCILAAGSAATAAAWLPFSV